ncbi:MAG TPA: glycoside hydrolase family 3 N-terminal domain-containing protein [Pseudonocardia sp.]
MAVHGPPPGRGGTEDLAIPRQLTRNSLRASQAREQFVTDLVAGMSVEEKVGQLTGAVLGPAGEGVALPGPTAPGVVVVGPRPLAAMTSDVAEAQEQIAAMGRLPIPALAVAFHDPTDLPAFPLALARAATWDTDLAAALAGAAADTLASAGVHATACPSVAPAVERAAWADIAGSLGSDPVLAAELAQAHVQGLQGAAVRFASGTVAAIVPDVGGSAGQAVKGVDNAWSRRSLRTTVLAAGEAAVRAGAAIVLPAAVANDGIPLHADSWLLQQLMRDEWGFTGVVMATADEVLALAERYMVAETADAALALAIESGVQVILAPAGDDDIPRRMLRLLAEGSLASWLVDAAVVSVVSLKLAVGLFDAPTPRAPSRREAREALAVRAAAGSTVLLTDPRGVLPLSGPEEILVTSAGSTVEAVGIRALVNALSTRHTGGARAVDAAEAGLQQDAAVVVLVDDPEGAEAVIGRLVATGRPCVALVSGGDPRGLGPIVATTAAVMLCWQPVNGHPETLADILLGAVEPGGRLPVAITGDAGRVVFPLGHGHGYTDVEYSNLRISADRSVGPADLVVQCRVTNKGDRRGKEVVQVHVHDEVASIVPPTTRLAAFTAVDLEPGRSMTVTLRIPAARLAVWNRAMRQVVEPGTFTVLVGRSALDLRLRGTVAVESVADLTAAGIDGS